MFQLPEKYRECTEIRCVAHSFSCGPLTFIPRQEHLSKLFSSYMVQKILASELIPGVICKIMRLKALIRSSVSRIPN